VALSKVSTPEQKAKPRIAAIIKMIYHRQPEPGAKGRSNAAGRFFSTILVCLSLPACDDSPQRSNGDRAQDEASVADQDAALLKNLGNAGLELERRLQKGMSVDDGLVFVRDPLMGSIASYVLPTSSPWVISCGVVGISVLFGTAVSGDGSSVGNDVEIHLASTFVNQDQCAVLTPPLGRQLKLMLEGLRAK
jgi:hypothetical protein